MKSEIRYEHWLFALFIFLIPFQSLLSSHAVGVRLQLADLVFTITLTMWLGRIVGGGNRVRLSGFHLLLGMYLVAVVLSTIGSVDPARSGVKLVGKLYLVLIALLSFHVVETIRQLRLTFYVWLTSAGVVLLASLLGIAGFYLGVADPEVNPVIHPIYGSLPAGNYPRVEGLFEYPAMFCNYLGVTWMLAIASMLNGWLRERYFWFFGGVLFLVNAFTLTPGLGGIFLSTGILLWVIRSTDAPVIARSYIFGGILIAVLFIAAASVTLFSYDSTSVKLPLAAGDVSASHRVNAWSTGLQTFLQDPILGRGVGMPVSEARYTDPNGNNQILTDAHNTYISVLAETGVLGFLTFFGMIFFIVRQLRRGLIDDLRWVRLCILLALVDAFFYQGLTGSYEDARHLWVLFGVAASVAMPPLAAGDESSQTSSKPE